MAYTRAYTDWKNFPDTTTPITEAKLDVLDQGIYNAHYNAVIQSDASGQIPLTARGTTGQTADLFRVQNSTPTTLFSVDTSGALNLQDVKLYRGAADRLDVDDEVRINRTSDTSRAMTFKGISGQPLAQVFVDGHIQWGAGDGTYDTALRRSAANTLSLGADDKLVVGSGGVQYSDGSIQTSAASNTTGTLSARPVQPYTPGAFYYASDQDVLYFSTGSAWVRISAPAGTTALWFKPDGAAPTGWFKLDGTALPSSTGIYADLYAHLGNTTTTPNTVGRVPVGTGTGAHADHATVGDTDGLAVGSRRIRHKHNITVNPTITRVADVQVSTPGYVLQNVGTATGYAGGGGDGVPNGGVTVSQQPTFSASGGAVGPQTGSEPLDSPAYINTVYIAKL